MMGDSCAFDDAGSGGLDFFEEFRRAEFVFCEGVDVGDWFASCRFANELYFITFNVFNAQDVEFGEEVQGEVVDGVAEDGLLDQEDVTFCFFDFLDEVEEVGPFFFEDLVHLSVVVYDDLVLHVGLGRGELELDEAYAGFFH